MRKIVALGALAAMAFGAQSAAADDISYNLIEGSYIDGDGYDGFGIDGSLAFTPQLFGHAGIESLDFGGGDGSWLSAGVGYNLAVNDVFDFVATAALKRIKVDGLSGELGYGLGVGARWRALSQLEVHGGLEYVDVDAYGSDTTLQIGARWYFTPNFAAGLDLKDSDDSDSALRLAVRYDFGRR